MSVGRDKLTGLGLKRPVDASALQQSFRALCTFSFLFGLYNVRNMSPGKHPDFDCLPWTEKCKTEASF
jgi:hypothetical protein